MEENIVKSVKLTPSPETPADTPEEKAPETPQETPETPKEEEQPEEAVETPKQVSEEQPPEEKAPETPEKVEEPKKETIDPNALLKEHVGMTLEEIMALKKEYEQVKDRPYVDDPELIPDDDFVKDLIKSYKRGGKDAFLNYIKAETTNFDDWSDEQIVKYELRQQYPDLPDKFLNRKYEEYLQKEFGFQSEYDDDQDKEYAEQMLRYHAQKKRQEFSDELKKFQVPERQPSKQEPDPEIEKTVQAFINEVETSPATKFIVENQKVVFDDFNYQVDPKALKDAALDGSNLFKMFLTEEGQLDLDKYYKAVAFSSDPNAFLKARDAHVIAKAKIEWMKEIKNPSEEPKPKPASNGQVKVRVV